jgi:hypothetical protein
VSKPKLDTERMASELSESSFFRDARRAQELDTQKSDSPTSPFSNPPETEEVTNTPKDVNTERPKRLKAETRFDLNEPAPVRRGFYFTDEELMSLDDLKKDLLREVDLKINQYDIIRIGMHFLIEDWLKNKDQSVVAKRGRTKIKK